MFLPPASRTTMSGRSVPSAVATVDLLVEVAAGAHPGQLDHPAQLQLAPAAPGLRPPQRGDQRLGLGPQLLGALPRDGDLLGQRGVRAGPGRVGLAQLLLDPGQGLPQRPDEVLDRRPAGLQLAGRGGVRRLQPALGDLQEPRRARVQRLRGQRLRTARRAGRRSARPAARRRVPRPAPAGRGQPPARVQVADRCPDDDPEQQADKQRDRTHTQRCSHRWPKPPPTRPAPGRSFNIPNGP